MQIDKQGVRWYKGNLHTHTTRSDGRKSPEEVADLYREQGYDFLALTDHWVLSQERQEEGMLLPIGEDLPKSLVVCCPKGGWQRVYLSPMSPATLQGRLAGPGGARNGTTQFLR